MLDVVLLFLRLHYNFGGCTTMLEAAILQYIAGVCTTVLEAELQCKMCYKVIEAVIQC